MRYLTLACDYDGTIAHHGVLEQDTIDALERLVASGRRLVLVTGRIVPDLQAVCPRLDLFEWVVAENGAVLHRPATREDKILAERPPDTFIRALERAGVSPLSVGQVVVATWEPHETAVLHQIKELGLELQVIFNKGAVMVLPAGVNKATGLKAALTAMELSPHNVVGVGDAENDHAFLRLCECSVAVANALPMLKQTADITTNGAHGHGVIELVDAILADDLSSWDSRLRRHHILLGTREDGAEVRLPPYRTDLLIAGPSGSGKSTTVTGFIERLSEANYQVCMIDPEGDYSSFPDAVVVGTAEQAPTIEEVMQHLRSPKQNLVVNLVSMKLDDRPRFFLSLLPRIQEQRAKVGRPHWLLIDEAHHLLPSEWQLTSLTLSQQLDRTILVTVEPHTVSHEVLELVDYVAAVGANPADTIAHFCRVVDACPPLIPPVKLETGEVLLWQRDSQNTTRVRVAQGKTQRRRHVRKYSEGELPPDRSFYFRGPDEKLNLRAQNLITFLQLAEGVDDATWVHHLQRGDYSRWMTDAIKDPELAADIRQIERANGSSPKDSRDRVREVIERRYTLPASNAAATTAPTSERST